MGGEGAGVPGGKGSRSGEIHIRKWPGSLEEKGGLDRQASERVTTRLAPAPVNVKDEREQDAVRLAAMLAAEQQRGVNEDCRRGLQRCHECFDSVCCDNINPLLSRERSRARDGSREGSLTATSRCCFSRGGSREGRDL